MPRSFLSCGAAVFSPANAVSLAQGSDRSQILFRYRRRWKTLTRAGYIPTAASLLLAQPFLLLLWLAIGALPAWAQTEAKTPDACASGHEFATTDCALTWHGITLYGAYDVGVGWVSHGLPVNGYNYEGESLVNRNGYQHRFLIAPNNLSQTGLGIRGKEEFLPGWSVVFNASTGINPQSGLLANASATRHHQQRPSPEQLFDSHRRRARGPTLQ